MPRVIEPTAGVPIHVWARELPEGALEQLERLAAQPYVVEHIAAMPDLHVANGVAVGSVFATLDRVVPFALGGDLGCGMSAVRFDFPAAKLGPSSLRQWLGTVTREIPVGDRTHRGKGVAFSDERPLSTSALEHVRARLGPKHLGTLGGGNHFIELDRAGNGDLWLLVHSGSRGLGSAIAAHHLRAAEGTGGALHADSESGQACLSDLEWAFSFARENRSELLRRAAEVVTQLTGQQPDQASHLDVHHNFVRSEEHFGRRLWVHRKGAISAARGERALIPGSMGTASYLVEGLGAPASFSSASHGAGRVLTRREAREQLRGDRFVQSMRRVIFDGRRPGLIEEAPAAYRDIAEVLEDEVDLVAPRIRLEPIAVLKG
jgi:tRNA-splicing ligase RtcB (3'-phosphate/5'-hydroxy nucleic acid ligase)